MYKRRILAANFSHLEWTSGPLQTKSRSTWPLHLFAEIQRQRTLFAGEELELLQRNVQINGYFSHPENLLLSMLADNRSTIRAKAVSMVLKVRRSSVQQGIRSFILPKINFGAASYHQLVTFQNTTRAAPTFTSWKGDHLRVSEPPLLASLSDLQIKDFTAVPLALKYPNHTQSVERAVKDTTEISARLTGEDRQVSEVLLRRVGRKKLPGAITRKRLMYSDILNM